MDLEVAASEHTTGAVNDRADRAGRYVHRARGEVVLVGATRLAVVLDEDVEPVTLRPAVARLEQAPRAAVVGLVDVEVVVRTAGLAGPWLVDVPARQVLDLAV